MTPPFCLRSNAASMDGQWNRIRRPPRFTEGILPVVRQLKSVRRETGRRFNSSFSPMKSDSLAGVFSDGALLVFVSICDLLVMFASGVISLHKHTSLLPCDHPGSDKMQYPCGCDGVTLCYGNTPPPA